MEGSTEDARPSENLPRSASKREIMHGCRLSSVPGTSETVSFFAVSPAKFQVRAATASKNRPSRISAGIEMENGGTPAVVGIPRSAEGKVHRQGAHPVRSVRSFAMRVCQRELVEGRGAEACVPHPEPGRRGRIYSTKSSANGVLQSQIGKRADGKEVDAKLPVSSVDRPIKIHFCIGMVFSGPAFTRRPTIIRTRTNR